MPSGGALDGWEILRSEKWVGFFRRGWCSVDSVDSGQLLGSAMRKMLAFTVLMTAGACVFGQGAQPYISLLPGTTLKTETEHTQQNPLYSWDRQSKTGFLGSIEGGFPMTRFVGIHFGYVAASQGFTVRRYLLGKPYGMNTGTVPVNILEVGPEFTWSPTENQQLYAQMNMGRTVGSDTAMMHYYYPSFSSLGEEHLRDNAWALGLALGYRWYFSKPIGICVQVTYHHVSGWDFSPIWAAQAGITFRF